jgi:uncharacterized protein (DUF362 family)
MATLDRRRFLQTVALASGAAVVAPGLALGQEATPDTKKKALMAIAKWQDGEASFPADANALGDRLVSAAIVAIGGMGAYVKKGDVVWIKPNMAWDAPPEHAATTNPGVVAALVRMCLESGAKTVKVGDHTCHPAQKSYPNSGIEAAVKEAGGEVVYLDANRFRETEIGGGRLEKWEVYPEIIESDLVINVPVAKHHSLSHVTLCMKNYMGVVGGSRSAWHQDMPTCLCDITRFMKPQLSVLDAVRVLTRNGPAGGNLEDVKALGIVAAGTDIVALDAFGATLLGHKPEDIATVVAAEKAGLGVMDYMSLNPKEIAVA